jgi:hypothetical protein
MAGCEPLIKLDELNNARAKSSTGAYVEGVVLSERGAGKFNLRV